MEYKCKFCGRVKNTTESGNKNHEMHCPNNPDRIYQVRRRQWTEADRKRISEAMKLAIKEGRAHGWANVRDNVCGMSYPEKWFVNMLLRNHIGTGYVYNKQFFKYKLDFAWPDKRLCIEIDGAQHYVNPDRQESDKCKDALLEKHGWRVLRLKWGYLCKHTRDAIEQVTQFLNGCGDIKVPLYKTRAELANEIRLQCMKDGVLKDKKGKFNRLMLSDSAINERKRAILHSGVNLSCFGWVQRVSEKTGLTSRIIYKTVERCPDLKAMVYRRKKFDNK
jgi:very-short-patch-repair endonuclease